MPQSAPTSRRVHFAEFEADLRAGELYRSGHKVKLQERPFQVLAVLLEHAGEVVTRDELRQRIWPADTFVDYGHGLAVAINKLRETLRDSPEQPRFIETVGRRGYRFVAEVETNGAEAQEPFAGGPLLGAVAPLDRVLVAPPRRKTRALHVAAIVSGAVLMIALFILAGFLKRRAPHNSAGTPHISSLAVLPLENLSNDPEQEYFVEGMTDEITTDVAKLSGLRVISRTSAMRYKNSRKSLPEIARELNVDGVVEGTIERLGDRVRIRTQLIYAPADQHIWAEVYERDVKDVLSLEADVANDIASHIELTLASQPTHPANQRAVNPDAHELYLRGRYYWNKRDPQDLKLSVQYFQQAIARDPGYALAYAGLADAYGLLGEMAQAKAAAEKALELDSELAEAHASLGLIDPFLEWNWKDSKAHFEKAIALNPNYATAHHWYGEVYLMPMGRVEDALAEIRKAQALDPLSAVIATDLGKDLYFARRYDDAVVELQHALQLDPGFTSAHNWLSDTYLEKRMFAEAISELERTKPFRDERTYLRQTAYCTPAWDNELRRNKRCRNRCNSRRESQSALVLWPSSVQRWATMTRLSIGWRKHTSRSLPS